jgi:hypothetical protein
MSDISLLFKHSRKEKTVTDDELKNNLEAFARLLAKDDFLRHEFAAKLSNAMFQTGSHIDSMPTQGPVDSGGSPPTRRKP